MVVEDPWAEPRPGEVAITASPDAPVTALDALRSAFRQAVLAVKAGAGAGAGAGEADPAEAFGVVVALDAALATAKDLVEVLPGLLAVADAGIPAEEELLRSAAEQASAAADVAALRAELDRRRGIERGLLDRAAEYELLRARVGELRHAEKVAGFLDTLRAQHDDLTERAEVFATPVAETERALELAAGRLLRLTDEQLGELREDLQRLLAQAASAQHEWAERIRAREEEIARAKEEHGRLAGELAGATAALERLVAENEQLTAALRAHATANEAITKSLGGLGGVGRLLREADAGLAQALAERERALRARHSIRFPGDDD
ncbi:hypothetical protein [Frankia sp. CiP1_Cm_nod2]|uniref:hypothetical protein n=1 Tax=Frankia sp. CiP1_Cm_nod2 TaxID=2897161 RepID=UPI0020243BB0